MLSPIDKQDVFDYTYSMVNRSYVLREIPDALWREVKAQAAERGVTIREALLELLRRWVKGRSDA